MVTPKNVLDNIVFYRNLMGKKQDAMAIDMDLSLEGYRKIENHTTKLTIDRFLEIAEILKVPVEVLINENKPSKYVLDKISETTNNKHDENNNEFSRNEMKLLKEQHKELENRVLFLEKQLLI